MFDNKIIYFIFVSFFVIYGCESKVIDMDAIQKKVNTRLQRKIDIKIADCREKALQDDEVYVDSIITDLTKNVVLQDLEFPEKPQRDTTFDDYQIKVDSINVEKLSDSSGILINKNDKKPNPLIK